MNQPVEYEWSHSLGEIVSVLAAAGLRIEFLHEHAYSVDRILECMEQDAQGRWRLKGSAELPLMFSLRAVK